MLRYVCPEVLDDAYRFSPSGTYFAPAVGAIDVVKEYALGLPMNDDPEIFGLHMNANIASQRTETLNLIDTVLSLQPRSSGSGGGRTPDEVVAELARVIEAELPAPLLLESAAASTFQLRGEYMDSLGIVLMQEMERFNALLAGMRRSLFDLQRAIRGEVLLSEELDRMYTSMLNNKVPGNWEALAYPSLKPLASWVKDLYERLRIMRAWLVGGQPAAFWISGFFFPQGFLTGVLQNFARKYAIAIDQLNFGFAVRDEAEPGAVAPEGVPADGVLVYGLYFDGARYDAAARVVTDSRPGEINSALPLVHFVPVKDYRPDPLEYSAPCYKTSTRAGTLSTTGMSTNYVISVELPTAAPPAKWILAGAALLTMLND
jgi:dynein heavy chain